MYGDDENVKSFATGLEVPNGTNGLKATPISQRSDSGIGSSVGSLNSDGSINNGGHSPYLDKSHRIPSFGPHQTEASGPQSKAHAKIRTYSDDADIKQVRLIGLGFPIPDCFMRSEERTNPNCSNYLSDWDID
jgi:hypothetical protein